jgi:hypothetical protein
MTKGSSSSGKLIGRALLVGKRVAAEDSNVLAADGLQVELTNDPYAAIAELAGRPLVYRALVLPLPQLFSEELALVRVVKRRFPHVQVIASEVPAQMIRSDELRRLGFDAILSSTALQPLGAATKIEAVVHTAAHMPVQKSSGDSEPVLTAEELRALLSDDALPASGTESR